MEQAYFVLDKYAGFSELETATCAEVVKLVYTLVSGTSER